MEGELAVTNPSTASEAIAQAALAAPSENNRAYWFLSNLVIVHVSSEETEGRFSLLELHVPPEDMPPLHRHVDADQTWYVLEGALTAYLPGASRVLRAGECAFGPKGIPHTHRASTDGITRLLEVDAPGHFEAFVVAVGRPAGALALPPAPEGPDPAELTRLAAEHGIEILGPPGTLP